ncbi:MAG: anaerobic ribonucleoside-triphosphate reductase activating protein [Oscillospiraceae bacterium]|nr:anaerobic ribonucleoside-triphosphate reductase activating protein [Oscillospiraceae bacterium]
MNIRIAGIVAQSIVDGPGLRLVVFTQGCPHNCPGCHSPQTHDFDGGQEMPTETILDMLEKNPLLKGITFSGGEPLARVSELLPLAQGARERGKDIICFTGYTFEQLLEMMVDNLPLAQLLGMIDLLVDGPYEQEQRDLTLPFRGSRNQRLLDLSASLARRAAVHWEAS